MADQPGQFVDAGDAFQGVKLYDKAGNLTSDGGASQVTTFVNRVFDTAASGFVRWSSTSPDSAGTTYPGPGVFGVDTSDYCVEREF